MSSLRLSPDVGYAASSPAVLLTEMGASIRLLPKNMTGYLSAWADAAGCGNAGNFAVLDDFWTSVGIPVPTENGVSVLLRDMALPYPTAENTAVYVNVYPSVGKYLGAARAAHMAAGWEYDTF